MKPTYEWDQEPGEHRFVAWGFDCVVLRNPVLKTLCGYLGLPPGHPWHGQTPAVDVHGGLTWAENHLPQGTTGPCWWLGFDCGHAGDLIPTLDVVSEMPEPLRRLAQHTWPGRVGLLVYRNVGFVTGELQALARHARRV